MKNAVHSTRARTAAPSPAVAGFRPAGVALAVAALMGTSSAFGQPTGAQVVAGQAQLQQQGNSLVVTTQNAAGTNRSVINWQSFSIPAGSSTRFEQPTAQSLSINRVLGNDPSAIYGTLSSNGRLVLVNPFGITVGAGAVVDTAGFTASTLRMSDADALAGRLRFTDDGTAGALSVNGTIVGRGGDVVLIAPQVATGDQAVIQSQGGNAILAAGRSVEITGRGLEGIVMQVQAPGDSALNLGTLQGDAVGIFAGTLKHSGLVEANAVTTEGGKVVLKAMGTADVSGTVQASRGATGGAVQVTGADVVLRSGSVIDVSGANGGGTAEIGGGWQGRNAAITNAQRTTLEAGAVIRADATANGNGGTVAVWSDQSTKVQGTITARGGVDGGDGGKVETSGHFLDMQGSVDTSAPRGASGMLLLDPTNIWIASSLASAQTAGMSGNDTSADSSGPGAVSATGTAPDSVLTTGTLVSLLGSNNVVVTTANTSGSGAGNITVVDPINWASSNELSLRADNSIAINASITGGQATLGLRAVNGSITQASPIAVSSLFAYADSGSVTLTNPSNAVSTLAGMGPAGFSFVNNGDLSIGYVSSTAGSSYGVHAGTGSMSIRTTGNLSVDDTMYGVRSGSGSVELAAGGFLTINGAGIATSGGAITLSGGDATAGSQTEGALYVQASLDTTAAGMNPAGANITLTSGLSDVGGNSVFINGVTINGGSAGVVLMEGDRVDVGTSLIKGKGISINADAGTIRIGGSSLLADAGGINISAGQATPVPGGDAVSITGSTLDAGAGSIQVTGSTADGTGYGVSLKDAVTLSAAGGTQVTGDNQDVSVTYAGGGVYVGCGQACPGTLTGTGALTLDGSAPNTFGYGVYIDSAQIARSGGALTLSGSAPGGLGVYVGSSDIDTGGSAVTLSSPGGSVNLDYSTLTSGAGAIQFTGHDVSLWFSDVTSTNGALTVAASGGGASIAGTSIDTGGGSIAITGGGASHSGDGVSIMASSVHAGTGDVSISGESVSGYGFYFTSSNPAATISGRDVTITGKNTSLGGGSGAVYVGSELISATNAVSLNATNGSLEVYNSTVSAGSGGISLNAPSSQVWVGSSTLASTGGAISVQAGQTVAYDAGSAVYVDTSTIDAGSGTILLKGTSTSSSNWGVDLVYGGSSLAAGAGITIVGSNTGTSLWGGAGGVRLSGDGPLDVSGALTVNGTAADAGGTGVFAQWMALTSTSGALTIDGSGGLHGVDINGSGTTLATNGGAISISGSDVTLDQALVTTGGTAAAVSIGATAGPLTITSSTLASSGGELTLGADAMALTGSSISSESGRTVITPTSGSRGIWIGGTDDGTHLYLDPAALNAITSSTLVIGGGAYSGGLFLNSPLAPNSPALSLIQGSGGTIGQAPGATITVANLNADAGSVALTEANNVQTLSGHATNGAGTGYSFSNAGGGSLVVGTVDGQAGITTMGAKPIWLDVPFGSVTQTAAMSGGVLTVNGASDIALTHAGNNLAGVSATSSTGNIALTNGTSAASSLYANAASGSVTYAASGSVVTVDGITAGSSVSIRGASIVQGTGSIAAGSGSIVLDAALGNIGSSTNALEVATSGPVTASAGSAGGSIWLTTPGSTLNVAQLDAGGSASLASTAAGAVTLNLANATTGGTLDWTGFTDATLGAGSGLVSAGGAINASGNVALAGTLKPGGPGGISSMSVAGDFTVLNGATLSFDIASATSYDTISATNVYFPTGGDSSSLVLNASAQPPNGAYTLISGATTGTDNLPTLSGNVANVTLAWGSLVANVAVPPPPPAPTPAPTPAPPPPPASELPLVDQITAMLDGDHATAQWVVATMDTNPLTTFTQLILQEEQEQAENGPPASDNIVATTTCKP